MQARLQIVKDDAAAYRLHFCITGKTGFGDVSVPQKEMLEERTS